MNPKKYKDRLEKQRAYNARFALLHDGLSPGAIAYRIKHGIPLSAPKCQGRRHNPDKPAQRVARRVKEGQPADCVIIPGEGRPDKCFDCDYQKYNKCLDFADRKNWKGWRIK